MNQSMIRVFAKSEDLEPLIELEDQSSSGDAIREELRPLVPDIADNMVGLRLRSGGPYKAPRQSIGPGDWIIQLRLTPSSSPSPPTSNNEISNAMQKLDFQRVQAHLQFRMSHDQDENPFFIFRIRPKQTTSSAASSSVITSSSSIGIGSSNVSATDPGDSATPVSLWLIKVQFVSSVLVNASPDIVVQYSVFQNEVIGTPVLSSPNLLSLISELRLPDATGDDVLAISLISSMNDFETMDGKQTIEEYFTQYVNDYEHISSAKKGTYKSIHDKDQVVEKLKLPVDVGRRPSDPSQFYYESYLEFVSLVQTQLARGSNLSESDFIGPLISEYKKHYGDAFLQRILLRACRELEKSKQLSNNRLKAIFRALVTPPAFRKPMADQ